MLIAEVRHVDILFLLGQAAPLVAPVVIVPVPAWYENPAVLAQFAVILTILTGFYYRWLDREKLDKMSDKVDDATIARTSQGKQLEDLKHGVNGLNQRIAEEATAKGVAQGTNDERARNVRRDNDRADGATTERARADAERHDREPD